MGFFKDFKEDASQAMKELMPQDDEVLDEEGTDEDDLVVNTLEDELDVESELSKLNGLLESVAKEETPVKEPAPETTQEKTTKAVTNKEEPFMSMEKETSVNPINLGGKAESVMPTMTQVHTQQEAPMRKPEPVVTDEVTLITEGSSLTGNLSSNGSIDMRGTVIGDVQCNGKLTVTGNIRGNTTSAAVKIGLGSVVVGNITATSAVIAGAIKGDIDVQGPVVVDTSAVVMGNIKSRSVQINNGAVIEGFCSQCYADVDVESLFVEE